MELLMFIQEPKTINLKFILPLSLLYLTIYLSAASVAYKMVLVGNIIEPGPPFIFPLSYALADVIAEVYGYKIAKKLIWLTLLLEWVYAIVVTLIVNLPSPPTWPIQSAYNQVFSHIIAFVFAGSLAIVGSSFLNIYAISKWKILMKGKCFWLRSIGSSTIGGLTLVAIIIIFGYSWAIDLRTGIFMFFSISLLEFVYACIMVWPAALLASFLKIKENLDVYDINTNFNPLSLR